MGNAVNDNVKPVTRQDYHDAIDRLCNGEREVDDVNLILHLARSLGMKKERHLPGQATGASAPSQAPSLTVVSPLT